MLFNSFEFLLFFPTVVIAFFALKHKYRWILLLAASYLFYGIANGKLLILILLSTAIDYLVSIQMQKIPDKEKRKPLLYLSLLSNLGILCVFKYYNFFHQSIADFLNLVGIAYSAHILNIALPVGISFYTFQTLAYTVDVYRGHTKAENHLGYFALYVSYFPQLVAGPIEKSQRLIPQLRKEAVFNYSMVSSGLKLMIWGFFKKVVIADQLGPMVQMVADNPSNYGGLSTLIASCFFSLQVYCDFSAYSDIAIGGARIMGVNLILNFNRPFFAKSMVEIWERWHISLFKWFKDYIYIPLGGSRGGFYITNRNIFIVFFISGLWHGASNNYVVWGVMSGVLVLVSRNFAKQSNQLNTILGLNPKSWIYGNVLRIKTFLLFSLSLIFFYPKNMQDSYQLFHNLSKNWIDEFELILQNENNLRSELLYLGNTSFEFFAVILSLVILFTVEALQEKNGSIFNFWSRRPVWIRWIAYMFITLLIILFSFDKEAPFIYFQF